MGATIVMQGYGVRSRRRRDIDRTTERTSVVAVEDSFSCFGAFEMSNILAAMKGYRIMMKPQRSGDLYASR
jgi:hypothetical protein